ncbi:MAG: ImuA family protein [Brevundimonas sp.]
MGSSPKIEALREHLKALEADGHPVDDARFNLGLEAADRYLGGLVTHGLHEVYAATTPDATAALGFALGLVRRAAGDRPVVWGVQSMAGLETGQIYGPGLRELGLDPGRLVLVRVKEMKDLLAAGEEALACGAVGAVLLTAWGESKVLSLTATRRLSMAAGQGRATAVLMRLAAQPQPSAAETRWRVRGALSRALEADAPGHPTYAVELLRHRLGAQPRTWIMEWDRERGVFEQGGQNAGHEQSQRPTLPGGLVSPAADGSVAARGGAFRRYG